jgi:hypothetical protein
MSNHKNQMKTVKLTPKATGYYPTLFNQKSGSIWHIDKPLAYPEKDFQFIKTKNLGLSDQQIDDLFFIVTTIKRTNIFQNEINQTINRRVASTNEGTKQLRLMDYAFHHLKQSSKNISALPKKLEVLKKNKGISVSLSIGTKKIFTSNHPVFLQNINLATEAFVKEAKKESNYIDFNKYGKYNLQVSEYYRLELAQNMLDYFQGEKIKASLKNKYLIIGYMFSFAGIELSEEEFLKSDTLIDTYVYGYDEFLQNKINTMLKVQKKKSTK